MSMRKNLCRNLEKKKKKFKIKKKKSEIADKKMKGLTSEEKAMKNLATLGQFSKDSFSFFALPL